MRFLVVVIVMAAVGMAAIGGITSLISTSSTSSCTSLLEGEGYTVYASEYHVPRSATWVVAADDTSAQGKEQADFVCDGIDDHETIQLAIDTLPASGGKVQLLEGTFYVEDNIDLASYLILEGVGYATHLIIPDGCDCTISMLDGAFGTTDVTVRSMRLDGNKAGQGAGLTFGIHSLGCGSVDENGVSVEDCTVENFRSHGIWYGASYNCNVRNTISRNNDRAGIFAQFNFALTISNNKCYDNGETGITADRDNQSYIGDNVCMRNSEDGIWLWDALTNPICIGNHCEANIHSGIKIQSTGDNVIGNSCILNERHGIDFYSGSDVSVIGNRCSNNSKEADDTYDNIHLGDGGVENNVITQNVCRISGGNRAQYGINVSDVTCVSNQIHNNDLYDSGVTGALNDAGTMTEARDNWGTTITQDKVLTLLKNTSGGNLLAGDVICYETVPVTGYEFETSNVQGSDRIYGVLAEDIDDNASGHVQILGEVDNMRVTNADGAIAVGDFLCQSSVAEEAGLAGAGDMVFAIALEVCDSADCVLDALLIIPRKL